jgi:hypothetical protein
MAAVNLDDLAHAATVVDSGDGEAHALVSRETGLIHMLNDEYMDDEAPVPADDHGDGEVARGVYVAVPAASTLGLGNALVLRFTAAHLPGDGETVRELLEKDDTAGFFSLLEERGEKDAWQRFRDEESRAALARWCEEHEVEFEK